MATITTPISAKAWSPDVQGFVADQVVPQALILTTSTVAGSIEGDEPALRVPYTLDDDATFVVEGAVIPEADPQLAEVVVHTGKIAQLVRLSREQLAQPNASQLITASLSRSVVKAADKAYLTNPAPVGPLTGSTGLLNTAGVVDGGTVDDNLDAITDLIAQIEAAGGTVSNVIAAPDAWASLAKLKAGTGSAVTLLGAGTQAAQRLLLGVPVVTNPEMPAGSLLVLDRTAVVSAVGQVQLTQSAEAYFNSDSIGVRVTWRIGWSVMRPQRIGKLTIT